MKKILILFILLSVILIDKAISQVNPIPKAGSNVLYPEMDKFVGNWVWTNGPDSVIIVLKKQNFQEIFDDYTQDHLVGFHQYKVGGQVIENNIQFQNTMYMTGKASILGWMNDGNNNIINARIRDYTKNKSVDLKLTLNSIPNSTQKSLTLVMKEGEGIHLNNKTYRLFTLPNNITLKCYVPMVEQNEVHMDIVKGIVMAKLFH